MIFFKNNEIFLKKDPSLMSVNNLQYDKIHFYLV